MRYCGLVLRVFVVFGMLTGMARADVLATPKGAVILEISGTISVVNHEGKAQFDLEMLSAIEPVEIKTSTIWTDGVHSFTGVPLNRLLEKLGVTEGTLKMTAINDYMVELLVSDAVEGGPILAYAMDGEPMSVRDKGPLWVIYPFDSEKKFQSETYYSRAIWQLNRIEVAN
jgi:hypothetical protein